MSRMVDTSLIQPVGTPSRRSRRTVAIPPESEAHFQAAIVELARALGWRVHHQYDARRSEPGVPDLLMVKDGRLIFAELKARTGRLTLEQTAWLTELGTCPGVKAYLWRQGETSLATIAAILRGGAP